MADRGISPKAIPEAAAALIASELRRRDITQRQVAQALGVADSTVSAWLRRHAPMPYPALEYVAAVLDTTVGALLGAGKEAGRETVETGAPAPGAGKYLDVDVSGRVDVLPSGASGGHGGHLPVGQLRLLVAASRWQLEVLGEHLDHLARLLDGGTAAAGEGRTGPGNPGNPGNPGSGAKG